MRLTIELEQTPDGWTARCLETGDEVTGWHVGPALIHLANCLRNRLEAGESIPQRTCDCAEYSPHDPICLLVCDRNDHPKSHWGPREPEILSSDGEA